MRWSQGATEVSLMGSAQMKQSSASGGNSSSSSLAAVSWVCVGTGTMGVLDDGAASSTSLGSCDSGCWF